MSINEFQNKHNDRFQKMCPLMNFQKISPDMNFKNMPSNKPSKSTH